MSSSRNLNLFGSSNPLPPAISLTPAGSTSTSQNRSRSGTLPSLYLNALNTLPLHNPNDPLGLQNIDHLSINNGIDVPIVGSVASASSARRMRSGSLFLLNSIWNDDNLSGSPNLVDNASIHSASLGSFLSPMLSALSGQQQPLNQIPLSQLLQNQQQQQQQQQLHNNSSAVNLAPRNRSYTTTGAVLQSSNLFGVDSTTVRAFQNSGPPQSDINLFLDSILVQNGHRVRARTLAGSDVDQQPLVDVGLPSLGPSSLGSMPQVNGLQGSISNGNSNNGNTTGVGGVIDPSFPFLGSSTFGQSSVLPPQDQNTPSLQEDFDFSKLHITTNFDNPNLGPTRFVLFDNLPAFINLFKLWQFIAQKSPRNRNNSSAFVVSIKCATTNQLNFAIVECASIEIAMQIKAIFNHMEIVPGVLVYAAFALIDESSAANRNNSPKENSSSSSYLESSNFSNLNGVKNNNTNSAVTNNLPSDGSNEGTGNGNANSNGSNNYTAPEKPAPTDVEAIKDSLLSIVAVLESQPIDIEKISSLISKYATYQKPNYQDNFGLFPDTIPLREFDSPKLRDLRKVLEQEEQIPQNDDPDNEHVMSQLELEELCLAMLDELPELCYDYLGNTIIQKIFTLVQSPLIKLMMVKEIAPYLTQLGIHKNGTWAIQKIINLCHSDSQQMYLIGASLKPYSVKLFNDQFGNYVLQGCLKFGTPFNDFIFEAILDNFLEISYGRFGARSIRTLLESADTADYILKEQFLLVTSLIVQFANELVVNANGSLLITWYLDSFNTGNDERYKLISNKFLPNLNELCCHKLANLTILKFLNNRNDTSIRDAIMDSIFGKFDEFDEELSPVPSTLLENILSEKSDNNSGPVFIYKILSNASLLSFGEDKETKNTKYLNFIFLQVRRILLEMNILNIQPYKKLMDEVGLSSSRLNTSTTNSATGGSGRRSKRGGRNNRGHQNGNNIGNMPLSNGDLNHKQQLNHQQQQQQQQQHHYQNNNNINTLNGIPNNNASNIPIQHNGNNYMNYYVDNSQFGNQQFSNPYQYPMMFNQQMMPGNGDFFGQIESGGLSGNELSGISTTANRTRSQSHLLYVESFPLTLDQTNVEGKAKHQQNKNQKEYDQIVMKQLEELSLSSAAMGYNSNPETPNLRSSQKTQFI